MKTKQLRNRAITLNFTNKEFLDLQRQKENSTCPNMALYIRKRLYSKKIVTTVRNRSQDDILEELSRNRKCLVLIRGDLEHAMRERSVTVPKETLEQMTRIMEEQTSLIKKLLSLWLP